MLPSRLAFVLVSYLLISGEAGNRRPVCFILFPHRWFLNKKMIGSLYESSSHSVILLTTTIKITHMFKSVLVNVDDPRCTLFSDFRITNAEMFL